MNSQQSVYLHASGHWLGMIPGSLQERQKGNSTAYLTPTINGLCWRILENPFTCLALTPAACFGLEVTHRLCESSWLFEVFGITSKPNGTRVVLISSGQRERLVKLRTTRLHPSDTRAPVT